MFTLKKTLDKFPLYLDHLFDIGLQDYPSDTKCWRFHLSFVGNNIVQSEQIPQVAPYILCSQEW